MRGDDQQQNHIFSYLSPEMRVRKDHPLRAIRAMVDEVLTQLSRRFDAMYARVGRPSIAPEKLLRAQLLQMLYSIRSERLLMEEMDYNLLFRWFVGLNADDDVWDATVFTKNRDRLLEADIATEFLARVVEQARAKGLTSDEHFTVDGTLLEAWASAKSFPSVGDKKRKVGWLKTIALMRKVRHRGVCKVDWIFTFACAAYNLVRIRNLATVPAR